MAWLMLPMDQLEARPTTQRPLEGDQQQVGVHRWPVAPWAAPKSERGELQSELTALFVPAGATRRGLVGWSGCAGGV